MMSSLSSRDSDERPPAGDTAATLSYVRRNLNSEQMHWLSELESTRVALGVLFMCHGTPQRDDDYLLQKVTEAGISRRSPGKLIEQLTSLHHPVLLCGHDHTPGTVHLPDGRIIVNPGSVGLPAYRDDLPFPHVMQTGTPHARYTVLTHEQGEWKTESIAVPYGWQSAANAAREHGRPDWAVWLETGRADIV